MEVCKGIINSVESFGSVDGPGIRYVVFMQGCNLRCKYCHNPETWTKNGTSYTVEKIFNQALKYKAYWGKDLKDGGITVSGGEPLLQIDFIIELFKLAKQHGIHTAIDTAGEPFKNDEEFLKKLDILIGLTDLFLVDIKAFSEEKHKNLTGKTNKNIFEFINYLSNKNKEMWIRYVLIPNVTDEQEELENVSNFISNLNNVSKVEVLPYHSLGVFKWKKLGIKYSLEEARTPTLKELERAKNILKTNNYNIGD